MLRKKGAGEVRKFRWTHKRQKEREGENLPESPERCKGEIVNSYSKRSVKSGVEKRKGRS